MAQSRSKKVVALSVGQTLTQVVALVTSAVLARLLTMQDLATYRQALLAYAFAAPLLTLALPQALYWFLPRAKGREKQVLIENLFLLAVMGLLFSCFLLFGGNQLLAIHFNNPELGGVLKWMIPYPLFMLPAGALSACLVAMERITALTVFNVVSRLSLGLLLIGVCLLFPAPAPLVAVNVLVAAGFCVVALHLMLKACSGPIEGLSSKRLLEMAKYSVPLGFATMLGTITLQMDKVIVSAMCSPEAFAIYSTGAMEIPLIGIITGSMGVVVLADMSKLVSQGGHIEALKLFKSAALRSAVILLPTMVFLLIVAPVFIPILFSSKYLDSVLPFRLYLLILPARFVYYGVALKALGLNRLILARSLWELGLNAGLSIICVKMFGYVGAILATLGTVYLFSIPFCLRALGVGFGVSWREVLPLRELKRLMLIAGLLAPLAALPLLLPGIPAFMQLAMAALLYLPVTLAAIYKIGLLPRHFLLSLMGKSSSSS